MLANMAGVEVSDMGSVSAMAGTVGISSESSDVDQNSICPVCDIAQLHLSAHLAKHSKEDIIQAVTSGRPVPEAQRRRSAGRPPKRPFMPLSTANVTPISPRLPTVQHLAFQPHQSQPQAQPSAPQQIILTTNQTTGLSPPSQLSTVTQVTAAGMQSATPAIPQFLSPMAHVGPSPLPSTQLTQNSAVQQATQQQGGNSYVLIGNTIIPSTNILPGGIAPLEANNVSYLIPNSCGMMLTATPASSATSMASQTVMVQAPISPAPVRQAPRPSQQPRPVTSATHTPMYRRKQPRIPIRKKRPIGAEHVYIVGMSNDNEESEESDTLETSEMIDQSENFHTYDKIGKNDIYSDNMETSEEPEDRTVIQLGNSISISLPKDVADQRERVKQLINQELVRALLINDSQHSEPKGHEGGMDEDMNAPSTSSGVPRGRRKEVVRDTAGASLHVPTMGTIYRNPLYGNRTIKPRTPFMSQETPVCLRNDDHQYQEVQMTAPTAIEETVLTNSIPDHDTFILGTHPINIDPNVPSPAHNITIENENAVLPKEESYPDFNAAGGSEESAEVRLGSPPDPLSLSGNVIVPHSQHQTQQQQQQQQPQNELQHEHHQQHQHHQQQSLHSAARDDASNSRYINEKSYPTKMSRPQLGKLNQSIDARTRNNGEGGSSSMNTLCMPHSSLLVTPPGNDGGNSTVEDGVVGTMCNEEDQPLSFLSSDKALNTLLDDRALEEMVYGEEQMLGAVEEVFSGNNTNNESMAGTSSLVQCGCTNACNGSCTSSGPSTSSGTVAAPSSSAQSKCENKKVCVSQNMYGEEQILGAVEEVFDGEQCQGSAVFEGTNQVRNSCEEIIFAESLEVRSGLEGSRYNSSHDGNSYTHQQEHFNNSNGNQVDNKSFSKKIGRPTNKFPMDYAHSSFACSSSQAPAPSSSSTSTSTSNNEVKPAVTQELTENEESVDDPSSEDEFSSEGMFPNDNILDGDLSNHQHEEVMSLKATETLADSDSERATPSEELGELIFYERSCMFAGEPGPPNLSPRSYRNLESSSSSSSFPHMSAASNALMSQLEHTKQTTSSLTHCLALNTSSLMHTKPTPEELQLSLDPSVVLPVSSASSGHILGRQNGGSSCVVSDSFTLKLETKLQVSTFNGSLLKTQEEDLKALSDRPSTSAAAEAASALISAASCSQRQPSPIPGPSTSGLASGSGVHRPSCKEAPKVDDEEYEFEYESDCYADSDSGDSVVSSRGAPLDLDHWRCPVCNKLFKSLKEKLLHAGQHSPCAEAMERSGAIRRLTEGDKMLDMLKCKEEMEAITEETKAMLESCAVGEGNYSCPKCAATFPSAEALLTHHKIVFKSRNTCHICHVAFKKRNLKVRHMKTHTIDDLRCLICNRMFPNHYAWSQHQLFHMGLVMSECKECGRRFQRSSELKIHMRTHTGERPYQCTACSNAFTTRQSLKRHVLTHMEGQEVVCDQCDKKYKNEFCLNKHRLKAHRKNRRLVKVRRDFMCSTCHEVFPSVRKLAWHQETHERWPKKCQQCGECFIHQSSLTKHIRQQHNPQHQTSDGKAQNNSTCPICRKVFKKSSLALHMRTHTGEKPHKCDICNRTFAVKCNLDAHKWTHMGVRDRPHKCKLCERSFHRKKDLEAHVRSHKNIRPFTCNECGKSFIYKNNLQLHVKEHSGEKRHKCSFCNKAFYRKYNLENHVRIHTGETPYECTICRKDFTQKSNYNVHMKAFHVERHTVHEEV